MLVSHSEYYVIRLFYLKQGRRYFKKVTTTLYHRYLYRGYLQIACVDCTRSGHPALWLVTWDPSQPTATRPLAIQKDGNWFTYGYDITKNVCEVFGPAGYIRTAYSYAPFGSVTESGDVTQPFQWSSEHYDSELDLVYYNYRNYSPTLGRFLSRDPIQEQGGLNLYAFVKNSSPFINDYLGKWGWWECIKRCLGFKSAGEDISGYSLTMGAAYLGAECIRFRNKYMRECIGKDHTRYCKNLKRDRKTVCNMATEAANIARQ